MPLALWAGGGSRRPGRPEADQAARSALVTLGGRWRTDVKLENIPTAS